MKLQLHHSGKELNLFNNSSTILMSFMVTNTHRQKHKSCDHQGIYPSQIHISVAVSCSIQYLKGRCLILLWFTYKGPNSLSLGGNKLEVCQRLAKQLVIFLLWYQMANSKQINSEWKLALPRIRNYCHILRKLFLTFFVHLYYKFYDYHTAAVFCT